MMSYMGSSCSLQEGQEAKDFGENILRKKKNDDRLKETKHRIKNFEKLQALEFYTCNHFNNNQKCTRIDTW